ncbi:MAG: hypothetical protein IJL17_17250 [Kiritimatiellae bacterium]|nr:hypothetical protein [Kiritimatiellia bacterium]
MNIRKMTKIPSVGRHGWTFLLGVVALAGGIIPASGGTTYYSGKGASNGTVLSMVVKWYADESRTTLADPQPTPTENDDNTYVFLESMKMTDSCSFSAVICTVPSTQADLSTTLKAAKIHGYTGRIEKDAETFASEGLVTYTATWTKTGFTVIFR